MTKDIILVVDDKEVNRFMICEIFRDRFSLLEAEDGEEAVELLKKYKDKITIVLLDIIMPNLDGFGVLDYMKKHNLLEEIPVVMRERQGGVSSITMKRSVYYMVKVTLAILMEALRGGKH